MMKRIITALLILININVFAQNVGINSTGVSPNSSAGLDVDFTSKGVLIPRLALTITTFAAPVTAPATSLMVYNTATVNDVTPGYYYWDGGQWVRFINTGNNAGTEWLLSGNTLTGTLPATPNEWIGTSNSADWIIKTNNIERMRVASAGLVGINVSPSGAYLRISSSNSSYDGVNAYHTSAATTSAFNAVLGNVNNAAYTQATGYLAYHNTSNRTFSVYGNGGDLAGMFSGKVGVNSVATDITSYDMEVRNNIGANPVNVFLRQTTSNTLLNSVLGNLDFGDNYNASAQARIQIFRDAASGAGTDLPTAMAFYNIADGASTLTERMRIANNGNVGIGTSSPSVNLEVSASDVATSISVINTNSTVARNPRFNIYNYGGLGGAPVFQFHNANGTSAVPLAVGNAQALGTIDYDGYDGAAFADAIKIMAITSEAWSGAGHGTYLSFHTTQNGTIAAFPPEKMRISDAGKVGINNTAPAMMLDVAGSSITAGDAVIRGVSTGNAANYGVQGTNSSATNTAAGVYGLASGNAVVHGVLGILSAATTANASGVRGYAIPTTGATFGVWGENGSSAGIGVFGSATNGGIGVQGSSNGTYAVYGVNTAASGYGMYGVCTGANGNGIAGICNNGATAYGVWGRSTTGYSGYFDGPGLGVNIVGNLNVTGTVSKGGGSFKIDHPLDPENKYLFHSFVESPEMMNIYNGNISTDEKGEVVVNLPSYFQAENMDYKYQLTVIGQFAQAIIFKEVSENQFVIKTDKPNVKVSWQVTGVRNDKWAQRYRIPNEVEKTGEEKGNYLYPELFGANAEKSIENVKHLRKEE